MLTIEDLANHLVMPSVPTTAADQAAMQRMLDAAADLVRAQCGTAATAGTSTLAVTATASGTAYVSAAGAGAALILPAVRISAVTTVVDPDGVIVTPLRVDPLAGIVWVPLLRSGTWRVTVVFDALPPTLELATLIIAAHMYETQRRPAMSGEVAPRAGYGGRDVRQPGSGSGYSVPNRAAELMAPYMLPGIA